MLNLTNENKVMDYKKKYKEALERAKEALNDGTISQNTIDYLYDIFPELKESEDEEIRKGLIKAFGSIGKKEWGGVNVKNAIVWLEKQGKEKSKKASIWKHWKNGIAGNGEGKPIYLIKYGHIYSISSCLCFECDYIELSELDKMLSENQGEQKPVNNIEPKFKVGDSIKTTNEEPLTITKIDDKGYWSKDLFICSFDEECIWDLVEQNPAWNEKAINKPNGGIVMEDFNDGNGFYKVNLAYLNEEQVEEIEELVKRWDLQPKKDKDESIISDLLDYFDEDKCLKHEVNDIVKWLKTIKPQQKGWGENEIKMLDNLITYLDGRKDLLEEIKCTYISWLKSLKQRIGGE